MQFIGNLRMGSNNFILVWTKNKTRDRFLIYSAYTINDLDRIDEGEEPVQETLTLDNFNSNKLNNYHDYLLSGIITSPKGGISEYIGDYKIIKQFISAYEKIKKKNWSKDKYQEYYIEGTIPPIKNITCKDEFSYYHELRSLTGIEKFNFMCDGVEFITSYKEDKNTTSSIGDDWVTIDEYQDKQLRDKFSMLGAKTLSVLRNEKDLSWYFDGHGRPKRNYAIVNKIEDVRKVSEFLLKLIEENRPFAVDTETTGLNIHDLPIDNEAKDHIVGMSISWKEKQGIYIPFDHVEVDNVNIQEALALLKKPLETGHVIAHNGIYDMKVFIDAGLYGICDGNGGVGEPIYLNVKEDTMILNFDINASASKGKNGLKFLSHTLLGCDTIELSDIFKRKKDAGLFRYLPADLITIYACADTDFTFTLWKKLRTMLHSTGKRIYQLDVRTAYHIARSEYYGNGLNVDMLKQLMDINQKDLNTLSELLYSFVGRMGKLTQLSKRLAEDVHDGTLTSEERERKLEEFQKSEEFLNSRYEFKISSTEEIQTVMYKLLDYPVLRVIQSSGKPSVDKDTLKDLNSFKVTDKTQTILTEDIYSDIVNTELKSNKDKDNILLEANEVNSRVYPFAYILSKWRKLEKLRTAFFEPYYRDRMGDKYFAPFKMCNAETGRITNKVQTLIGHLKKLIKPLTSDHYLLVFDFAQVEYRAVAGLAHHQELIDALCPPRADYHREGGAKFYGVEPYQITNAQRKDLKVANFAKLYKMSDPSLSESLYGRVYDKEKREENLMKARVLSKRWEIANHKEKELLDRYSDFAVVNRYVENVNGRRRYFKEGILSSYERAKIERMAGNFPVQSFAADIFKLSYIDFNERLIAEGIDDKVKVSMLIHDEMVCSVHKSISPYFMYKLVAEEVMKDIKGHPPYYAGISVCENWYEGKADLYEAPIEFVQAQISKPENQVYNPNFWCDCPRDMVVDDIKEFMKHVYITELQAIADANDVSFKPDALDLESFIPHFTDYFLKPKMDMYMGSYREGRTILNPDGSRNEDATANDKVFASIEKVFADYWKVNSLSVKYPNEDWQVINIERDNVDYMTSYEDFINEDELILSLDDMGDLDSLTSNEVALEFDDEDARGDSMLDDMSVPTAVLDNLHASEEEDDDFEVQEYVDENGITRYKVNYNVEHRMFDQDDTRMIIVNSGRLYVNVTNLSVEKFKTLHAYLTSKRDSTGIEVSYKLNDKIKDTNLKVKNVSVDEIADLIDVNFFSLQLNGEGGFVC